MRSHRFSYILEKVAILELIVAVSILCVGCLYILLDMNTRLDGFVKYIVRLYHMDRFDMLLRILDLHIFLIMDILDRFYIEE